jgi:NAD-dependent dihydropyrimidine dehydrogenase PreA subunit
MTYVITEPCVDAKHRSCIDVCPVDCIYAGDRMLYINPAECIDCGACEPACPVDAIFYEIDLPETWSKYQAVNAEAFASVGDPGGSASIGLLEDHPDVVSLPVTAQRDA